MRGVAETIREQAWKRPQVVIIGRGTVLSRVNCCDAVWKWGDGAGTWLGGSTAVDRNARRRNDKEWMEPDFWIEHGGVGIGGCVEITD